nr:hypothetical protein [Tanacetum cinerariifolium]
YESASVSRTQELSPTYSLIQDDSIPDEQVHVFDDEVFGNDHIPKADSRKDWWKSLPEDERPVRNMMNFLNWYCRQVNKTKLTQADFKGQVDWMNLEGDQVRVDVNRPLPLGAPPCHVNI